MEITAAAATPKLGASPRPSSQADSSLLARDFSLDTADGRQLAATWTEAPHSVRAVAVINSAVGVPRGYYAAFAQWLTGRGYAVLSYDYRGMGGSRRGTMRAEAATMADWAVLDVGAALAAAQERRSRGALPLIVIGHSFGGNCLGFVPGIERTDAILTVASQMGEPRLYPGVHRWTAEFFFRAWIPVLVPLLGQLPGWALGPGAQALPGGVAQQWARWGRTRGWAYADPDMHAHRCVAAVVAPVHLWNISDDLTYAPARAVDALAAQFRNAAVQRHSLRPADVGLRRLGHFGAFRRAAGPRLWAHLLSPIEQAAPALARAGLG